MTDRVEIGVSACLLGENVRYDGGNRHDGFITGTLGRFFRLVPVCPEVESGMPVPRDPMRLEGDPNAPRMMTIETRIDRTEQMLDFCRRKLGEAETGRLSGLILKKNSPSCGISRVKVHVHGTRTRRGAGLFAAAIALRYPLLPIEDEGSLGEQSIRENFIERVFAYNRWRDFLHASPDLGMLVEFHTRHKLLLMAHAPLLYRQMGRLVAQGKSLEKDELFMQYEKMFMKTMAFRATAKKNTDVLLHCLGYFKKVLDRTEKEEMLRLIEQYREGGLSLAVPLTRLRHFVKKFDQQYLAGQLYLFPGAEEQALLDLE